MHEYEYEPYEYYSYEESDPYYSEDDGYSYGKFDTPIYGKNKPAQPAKTPVKPTPAHQTPVTPQKLSPYDKLQNRLKNLKTTQPSPQLLSSIDKATSDAYSIICVGQVDAGKSTLLGRILYELNIISQDQVDALRDSAPSKKKSFCFAWIFDQDNLEREKGVTINISNQIIKLPNNREVNLIDAPGHKQFINNILLNYLQPEAAILMIDASDFDKNFEKGTSKEHSFLMRAIGVEKILIVLNKFEKITENPEKKFYEISEKISEFLTKKIGFKKNQILSVPVSAFSGENILNKKFSWYKNENLIEILEKMPNFNSFDKNAATRVLISDKISDKKFSGKILSGKIFVGQNLVFCPNLFAGKVEKIIKNSENVDFAISGDFVEILINFDEKFEENFDFSGKIFTDEKNLIFPSKKIRIRALTSDIASPLLKGERLEAFCCGVQIGCKIKKIKETKNLDGSASGGVSLVVRKHQIALMNISFDKEMALVSSKEAAGKALGRVILRRNDETVAVAVIEAVRELKN